MFRELRGEVVVDSASGQCASRRTKANSDIRPGNAGGLRSLLRQPRLAQRVERGLQNRFAPDQPFDAELGIEAESFGERGRRLIHIAFQPVGGGEIQVRIPVAITGVDRLVGFVDRGVEMAEAELSCGTGLYSDLADSTAWPAAHRTSLARTGASTFRRCSASRRDRRCSD
jgi:hypothetical protein